MSLGILKGGSWSKIEDEVKGEFQQGVSTEIPGSKGSLSPEVMFLIHTAQCLILFSLCITWGMTFAINGM